MSKPFFFPALIAGTLFLAGCQSPAAPVEPQASSAPGPTGEIDFSNRRPAPLSTRLDVVYSTVDSQSLPMDIHYPSVTSDRMPVVVYLHSGGWYQGDKSEIESGIYGAIRQALHDRGVAVVSLNYRLVPGDRFPAQIEDVRAALGYLADHADSLSIDPERLVVMGASSGGHLAAQAALAGPDETPEGQTRLRHRPRAAVSLYGVLDLEAATAEDFSAHYSRLASLIANACRIRVGTASPLLAENSPMTYASADDPPIWLTHGDGDTLVPPAQSQALHDRMTAVGGQSTLVMVKRGGHGYFLDRDTKPTGPEIVSQIEKFVAQHLGL